MAGCVGEGSGIAPSRVNARFVKRAEACLRLGGVADVLTLGGTYLTISDTDTKYYVWFNVDGGSLDPAPAGLTGIEVAVDSSLPVRQVSINLAAAIDAVGTFIVQRKNDTIQVNVKQVGQAFDVAADVDSGVNVVNHSQGFEVDLGLLEGDVEIATERTTTDVAAHQTGETPISRIVTGQTVSTSLVLLEFSGERKKELLSLWGNDYTDSEGNFLQGIGSKDFTKTAEDVSGSLLLDPVDGSVEEKKAIWKAYLSITSILHAATDPFKVTLEFSSLIDKSKPADIDIMAIGDYEDILNGVAQ